MHRSGTQKPASLIDDYNTASAHGTRWHYRRTRGDNSRFSGLKLPNSNRNNDLPYGDKLLF
jgi:hypothetical protein